MPHKTYVGFIEGYGPCSCQGDDQRGCPWTSEPGKLVGNPPGSCGSVEALPNISYGDAERMHQGGRLSTADWERFCYVWRNASPRFSDLAEKHEDPTYPEHYTKIFKLKGGD